MWGMYMHMFVHVHVVLHACIFVCVCGMSMGAWYGCMCLSVVCAWYVYMDVCLHTSTDFWLAGLNIQLHLPRHTQSQSLGRVWALRRNWDPEPVRYVLYLESRALHTLGLSISDPSTSHIFPVTEGSTQDKVAKIPFILSFFALQLTEGGKCVWGVRSESKTVGLGCVGLTGPRRTTYV